MPAAGRDRSLPFWVGGGVLALALGLLVPYQRQKKERATTDALTAQMAPRLWGKSIAWKFETGARDTIGLAASTRPYIVLLLVTPTCEPCTKRREALTSAFRTNRALSDSSDLWVLGASDISLGIRRDDREHPGIYALHLLTPPTELSPDGNLPLPVALKVARTGKVVAVSAGYRKGIDDQWLTSTALAGAPSAQ